MRSSITARNGRRIDRLFSSSSAKFFRENFIEKNISLVGSEAGADYFSRQRERKKKAKRRPILSPAGGDSSMPYGEAPWVFTGRCVFLISRGAWGVNAGSERETAGNILHILFDRLAGRTTAAAFLFSHPRDLNLDLRPHTKPLSTGHSTSSSSSLSPRPRNTSRQSSTSSACLGTKKRRRR